MPDEPDPVGGSDIPDPAETGVGSNDDGGGAGPPPGDPYRWYGPSGHTYPGAETHTGFGGQYAPPQTPRSQYGPPQGTYPPQHSPPYSWPYVPPSPRRPALSPEERRRRARRRLALAGVVVLALGAGIGIGAAIAPTSPATAATALVSRAITAGIKAGTYHYVEKSSFLGASDDIEGDAAPNGGRQVIRQECRPVPVATTSRTSIFDLRLVGGLVYFRGNVVAVVDELGVPAANATSVAGEWVKVEKGETTSYKTFAEGISTTSNIAQLRTAIIPLSSKAVPRSSPASTEVLGALLKTTKNHRTLGTAALVMATSSGLPRALRGSAVLQTGRDTLTWKFTGYGEKVRVVAPPHPLSYPSLNAKKPATGTCA